MAKSLTESREVQGAVGQGVISVQMPLPTLAALADVRQGFMALCVSAGREGTERHDGAGPHGLVRGEGGAEPAAQGRPRRVGSERGNVWGASDRDATAAGAIG